MLTEEEYEEAAKPSGEFSPSLEAQETQLESAQNTAGSMPQGDAAKGYAAMVAKHLDEAHERTRREFYKDNEKGYQEYLGFCRFADAATLESAMKYEAAQLRHAANMESEQMAADIAKTTRREIHEWAVAGQTEKYAAIEAAQKDKAALDGQAERVAEEAGAAAGDGEEGKAARSGIAAGLDAAKAGTTGDYASRTKAADNDWMFSCERMYVHVGENLKRLYKRVETNAMNAGATPLVAKAKAEEACRQAAVDVMNGLIEDGNHEIFVRWADKLGKTRTMFTETGNDGKPFTRIDAMARWCLGGSDLKKLSDAYLKAELVKQRQRNALAANARMDAISKVENLRLTGDRACYSTKLDAESIRDYENVLASLDAIAQSAGDDKVVTRAREASEHLRALWASRGRTEEKVSAQVGRINDQKEFEEYWDWLCEQGNKDIKVAIVNGSGKTEAVMADVSLVKYKALSEALGKGLCTGRHGTSGRLWSEIAEELEKSHGVDVEELGKATDGLRRHLNVRVLTDKDAGEFGDAYMSGWGKDREKINNDGTRFMSPFSYDENGIPGMDKTKRYQTLAWTGTDGKTYTAPWEAFDKAVQAIISAQKITPSISADQLVKMAEKMLMSGTMDAITGEQIKATYSGKWFGKIQARSVDPNQMRQIGQVLGEMGIGVIPSEGEGFKSFVRTGIGVAVDFARLRDARRRKAENEAKIRELEAKKNGGAK